MIYLWLCTFLVHLALSKAVSDCEDPPLDLSIVIDQTKSVGRNNYDTMLESVRKLISKYNVGPDKTRISIVTYHKTGQVRASFDETKYQSQQGLNKLLDEMKANDKLGSPTRTDKALEVVNQEVFNTKNGDRPDSPNVMIVFTDGATHKSSKPYSEVLPPLVAKGVNRIAVGIGRQIKTDELETIAGSSDRVVNAASFNQLEKQLDKIREVTCSIDGGYTEWSKWSKCSATCGGGVRWHSRTCTNPSPKNKGKTCKEQNLGPDRESQKCNTQECATNGGYTEWSKWSKCSATCGGGVRWHSRTCTNPSPKNGGETCKEQNLGPARESQKCNTQKCGVDGNWSPWSNPGPCDKTCGGGVQVRKRTCTNPPPSGDGKKCTGPSTKTESCNPQKCPPPPPPPCKEHLDVGVILDSSNSIKPYDYQTALSFLQSLARRLEISDPGTHMAILLYSWEAHTVYRFTDPQNINALLNKISTIPHIQGGTRTDRALELAGEDFFGWTESGDRPNVPNVLLVLTDGDTNEGSKPFSQVLPPIVAAGVRRIAVGIGNEIHLNELYEIAGNYEDVIQVQSYSGLIDKLESIMKLACEDQVLGSCGVWESYGSCSKSCGSGFKVRKRQCPGNSLHLQQQKTICNTNLCPGQEPCQDSQSNCPSLAAAGNCWKQATGKQFYQTFTLWNQCKKSCRRCNVDTSQCQDNDPYLCPWLSAKTRNNCRWSLKSVCKKSCGTCGSSGGGGSIGGWGGGHGGHGGGGWGGGHGGHGGGGRIPGGWGR